MACVPHEGWPNISDSAATQYKAAISAKNKGNDLQGIILSHDILSEKGIV